jgi:hypothetical protein
MHTEMRKGQAFFVVGHRHWGKSRTLRAVKDGVRQRRSVVVGGRTFWVREMSNDDKPAEWADKLNELDPNVKPQVILTLCPTPFAEPVLQNLRRRYDLFFWILQRAYDGERVIRQDEVGILQNLGTVEQFNRIAEADVRAARFRRFVEAKS